MVAQIKDFRTDFLQLAEYLEEHNAMDELRQQGL